jgi:hypothetical protein
MFGNRNTVNQNELFQNFEEELVLNMQPNKYLATELQNLSVISRSLQKERMQNFTIICRNLHYCKRAYGSGSQCGPN